MARENGCYRFLLTLKSTKKRFPFAVLALQPGTARTDSGRSMDRYVLICIKHYPNKSKKPLLTANS
jgi:hypothetical protein